jgi:DNA repair protein RadC
MKTVRNEDSPVYLAQHGQIIRHEGFSDDKIISMALDVLQSRMKNHGAVLSSPRAIRDYLSLTLAPLEHEVFTVLFLDAQHQLIESEEMFRGTLTQTSVYPREVVKRALYHNAAAVVLAHNHPSGNDTPSRSDEMLTDALKQALELVDVRVLDHFIVAGMKIMSFAERGLI